MSHVELMPEDFFDLSRAEQEFCHEEAYLQTYKRFCNPIREEMRTRMEKIVDGLKIDDSEFESLIIKLGLGSALSAGSTELNKFILNRAVAKSIVAATVKGSVDAVGRRGAIIVAGETMKYSMAVGGHAAINGGLRLPGRDDTL